MGTVDNSEHSDPIPAWVGGRLAPVGKLAVHQQGLRHLAVSVFVVCDGQILVQKRSQEKYHTPGLWANTCCTHPHWNEAPDACARRRLAQELGISGLTPEFRHQVEYRADVGRGLTEHEVVSVFVSDVGKKPPVSHNPAEVEAVRWLALEDLVSEVARTPERFTPWLKIYLDDHASAIFG